MTRESIERFRYSGPDLKEWARQLVTDLNREFQPIPTATVAGFGGSTLPANWTDADGSLFESSAKSALFREIGTVFGSSGTKFAVPNLDSLTSSGSTAVVRYMIKL